MTNHECTRYLAKKGLVELCSDFRRFCSRNVAKIFVEFGRMNVWPIEILWASSNFNIIQFLNPINAAQRAS